MDTEKTILKAGFARACITPPLGTPVPGYFYERLCEGVLDDIYATCLALDDGEKKCLIYSVEVLGCTQAECGNVKKKIKERLGVDEEAVYIAATHSHTAFTFCIPDKSGYDILQVQNAWLENTLVDLAQFAIEDLKEVTAFLGSKKDVYGAAFIRKYLLKDGTFLAHPKFQDPRIVKEVGKQDYAVQFLRFQRKDAKEILLCNFGTHADTISGNLISGDWPGDLTRKAESVLGVNAITLVGCQGNSNCSNKLEPIPPRKANHDFGFYVHKKVANIILAGILEAYEDAEELEIGKIGYTQKLLEVGINNYTEDEFKMAQEMEKIYTGKEIHGMWDPLLKDFPISHVKARRILRTARREGEPYNLNMTAINVGDVVFCGISGEPYCEIGLEIKEKSPFKMTFVTCQTNGNNGYFPDYESCGICCYESDNCNFDPHIADFIADFHGKLTNELFEKKSNK